MYVYAYVYLDVDVDVTHVLFCCTRWPAGSAIPSSLCREQLLQSWAPPCSRSGLDRGGVRAVCRLSLVPSLARRCGDPPGARVVAVLFCASRWAWMGTLLWRSGGFETGIGCVESTIVGALLGPCTGRRPRTWRSGFIFHGCLATLCASLLVMWRLGGAPATLWMATRLWLLAAAHGTSTARIRTEGVNLPIVFAEAGYLRNLTWHGAVPVRPVCTWESGFLLTDWKSACLHASCLRFCCC